MSEPLPLIPLGGIGIKVDKMMVGCKIAVRIGNGPIHVSPAMYDLISHADEKELRHMLESINLLTIPEPDYSMPMTTNPFNLV